MRWKCGGRGAKGVVAGTAGKVESVDGDGVADGSGELVGAARDCRTDGDGAIPNDWRRDRSDNGARFPAGLE